MQINRDQFLEDGYLVLRQVIPPDQLDDLRVSYEHLVKQQKAIWATERSLNAPSSGVWKSGFTQIPKALAANCWISPMQL